MKRKFSDNEAPAAHELADGQVATRQAKVASVKEMSEYQRYAEKVPKASRGLTDPQTPRRWSLAERWVRFRFLLEKRMTRPKRGE